MPGFLLKRITPAEAGAAVVRGIEERAPRIFAPKWWRYVSALRGLLNPLLDRRAERDRASARRSATSRLRRRRAAAPTVSQPRCVSSSSRKTKDS